MQLTEKLLIIYFILKSISLLTDSESFSAINNIYQEKQTRIQGRCGQNT